MGNLGTKKKKEKEDEVTGDVWMKLNDDKTSPKSKKKKKKKRKRKGKDDSPDGHEEDVSQCDSYSYSTLSSRKLSDDTIASAGTITHQNTGDKMKYTTILDKTLADDQSNGSIGYVTASDTFTPPSQRKGRQAQFSPVIARNSPRVVRRLLQSEKILSTEKISENKNDSFANLSPRAKFFLSTPVTTKSNAFETRKYSRHSSGSSIDSRTYLGVPDDYKSRARGNDSRYIISGSLISKSDNQGSKNNYEHGSRLSNNSIEMSDSTAENLVKTGEKAKLLRYDSGNMSPAERRKNKQHEMLGTKAIQSNKCDITFAKLKHEPLKRGDDKKYLNDITNSENKITTTETYKINNRKVSDKHFLTVNQEIDVESVPPPSPASGIDILELDESEVTENEALYEKHLNKDEETFGDTVCKRLSLLLESEQDKSKLNRSEFHEFTDSPCSSPENHEVPEIIFNEDNFVDSKFKQSAPKYDINCKFEGYSCKDIYCDSLERPETLLCEGTHNEKPKLNSSVKTPQGKENASVLDVMNNNFRLKANEDVIIRQRAQNVDRVNIQGPSLIDKTRHKNDLKQEDIDIEEQMRHENEINEKLIEERVKTLNEIFQPPSDSNKRSSVLFAVNNKHTNDPDNYILVTKKTYCVKRGVLVELLDEEKDVITRDVIKTINGKSDWIATGSGEVYKPETMVVEQGSRVICPEFIDYRTSDSTGSFSEPDYVNLEELRRPYRDSELEDFERHEREFDETPSSDEEIDFENVLNRSQSQSDSGSSETRQNRESDILREVISSYKDEDYTDYSDEVSEEEILYRDEPRTKRDIRTIIRTPSKLDKSIKKLFQEKQLAITTSQIMEPKLSGINVNPTTELYCRSQAGVCDSASQTKGASVTGIDITPRTELYYRSQTGGYDSPYHKSSEGSRRSLAYTESDLDISEKWDDDDDASNDSMLADDEDDDDDFGEIIFSKPYLEQDQKVDALFSYNTVKTLPESPVMWEPEQEDDEVFHDNVPLASYNPEDSIESSDEAFDDARKQMQEIHEQLQTLREQMVTFDKDEEDSSLPTSPLNDRMLSIPKAESD